MMGHYARHGKSMGYKGPVRYTLGAVKHIAKSKTNGILRSGGRAFINGSRTAITYGYRVGSYNKARSAARTLQWFRNNLR